jgi:hypothetical protein
MQSPATPNCAIPQRPQDAAMTMTTTMTTGLMTTPEPQ